MSDAATPQVDPRDMTIAEQANRIADLTKLVAEVTQENKQFREENKQLKERTERLEALLATKLDAKSSKKPVFKFFRCGVSRKKSFPNLSRVGLNTIFLTHAYFKTP